jgi:hypothetical protein
MSEINEMYAAEREESRSARYGDPYGTCQPGRHHMVSDRRGGGACRNCSESVRGDEL